MSSVRLGTTTTVCGARGSGITRRASGSSLACKAAKRLSSSAEPGSGTSTKGVGVEIIFVTPHPWPPIITRTPPQRAASRRLREDLPNRKLEAGHDVFASEDVVPGFGEDGDVAL